MTRFVIWHSHKTTFLLLPCCVKALPNRMSDVDFTFYKFINELFLVLTKQPFFVTAIYANFSMNILTLVEHGVP